MGAGLAPVSHWEVKNGLLLLMMLLTMFISRSTLTLTAGSSSLEITVTANNAINSAINDAIV
jgi:hypothetical protein